MNDDQSVVVPSTGNAAKLNRSCEECRARKIRCYTTDSAKAPRCVKCIDRGLSCTFAPVTKRRRRRVDARIHELEGKIQSLLTTIGPPNEGRMQHSALPTSKEMSETPGSISEFTPLSKVSNCNRQESFDVVEIGLITPSKAAELYQRFHDELSPHYPAIYIPKSISVELVKQEKPMLFLSIITAAAASFEPVIASVLNRELEKGLAHCVMIAGEKSLGLAQALLISAIWNYPPDKFDSLKFGRYAQMAADIVLDLNVPQQLDRHFSTIEHTTENYVSSDVDIVDNCRTLVACFLLCSSVALAFRRPSTITFTPVIGKCVTYLKSSPYAAPCDQRLAIWVELQRQAEEFSLTLTTQDRTRFVNELPRVHIADSIVKLTLWMRDIDKHQLNDSIIIHQYYIRMYMHEQTLHSEHRPEDFKPPYTIRNVTLQGESDLSPENNTLFALNDCLLAGRMLLDTFLGMSVGSLRTVPVVVYTRMFYAIVIFAKLYTSVQALDSRFQGLIDIQSLAFDSYVWKIISLLRAVQGQENFRVPMVFLGMLERLSQWCVIRLKQQLQDLSFADAEEEWQPMRYDDAEPVSNTSPNAFDISSHSSSFNSLDTTMNPDSWEYDFDAVFPLIDQEQFLSIV